MEDRVFLEDIFPPDLLYVATIRSPVAKGNLKFIQKPDLPQGYFFITAANIPGENRLEDTNIQILADKKLSFIGEPVAIILGHDKTVLEELAGLCTVAADEEKPVFSFEQYSDKNEMDIAAVREIIIGNPQEVFSNAGQIVSSDYVTGIQDQWYAEPTGAVVWYQSENKDNNADNNKKTKKNQDKDKIKK